VGEPVTLIATGIGPVATAICLAEVSSGAHVADVLPTVFSRQSVFQRCIIWSPYFLARGMLNAEQ
jgi:hypothetical protein